MKKLSQVLLVTVLMSVLVFAGSAPAASARELKILQFGTMVGVPQPLTGAQAPIRGINGGGLPWMVGSAQGSLTASGALKVSVKGLVFAAGPNTGSNTVAQFRALVSCINADGTISNIPTAAVPATLGSADTGGGDAEIETTVALPHPCIAPIIFVTSPGGSWFAATGY
ncbi:MAG: hypothetical protein ACM3MF_03435 [Anaerolineae bacterium]